MESLPQRPEDDFDESRKSATQRSGVQGPLALADRYRVLARVGVGGTAVVYRCEDLHTGHIVAMKALRTNGPLIPEAAKRFAREARMAATLSHPHLVRVLDFGYTIPLTTGPQFPWVEDGDKPAPYLAMEYIFGPTLKQLVRRFGPLPFDWIWTLGEQLCAALSTAHAAGIVHRDIKPQNVLIVDSRLELIAKLTDFGIARQMNGDLTTLTVTGQVLGTPDYLSPEQVLGEPGGPASDLYSLGIVLYELITGRLPFEAETPLAAASRRMVADPPPLTAFRHDAPWPLQEVMLLALRREPSERFTDALDFAQALRWSRERSQGTPKGEPGGWLARPAPQGESRSNAARPNSARPSAPRPASQLDRRPPPLSAALSAAPRVDEPPVEDPRVEDTSVEDAYVQEPPEGQPTFLRVAPIAPDADDGAPASQPLDDETFPDFSQALRREELNAEQESET